MSITAENRRIRQHSSEAAYEFVSVPGDSGRRWRRVNERGCRPNPEKFEFVRPAVPSSSPSSFVLSS